MPNASHSAASAAAAEAVHGYDAHSVECHLALGGTRCMLPTVLPAWERPSSGALAFLGNHSAEGAPAARLRAVLGVSPRARAEGRARGAARVHGQRPARLDSGDEVDTTDMGSAALATSRCGRRLSPNLPALRAAIAAAGARPMLEVASLLQSGGAPGGPGSSGVLSSTGAVSSSLACREPDAIDEEGLQPAERERLQRLRQARPRRRSARAPFPHSPRWPRPFPSVTTRPFPHSPQRSAPLVPLSPSRPNLAHRRAPPPPLAPPLSFTGVPRLLRGARRGQGASRVAASASRALRD